MYFYNKEVDPRDCLYRASSNLRKQIEKVIRFNKIKFGLLPAPKTDYNYYENINNKNNNKTFSSSLTATKLKNRLKSTTKTKQFDTNNDNDKAKENNVFGDDDNNNNNDKSTNLSSLTFDAEFSRERMISLVEQLESILLKEEEKQTFTYDTLVKMHQLLQYLEEENDDDDSDKKDSAKKNKTPATKSIFRIILPEKRKNIELNERLQKLKYQAANRDYNSMTANILGRAIGGSGSNDASNGKNGYSLSQEMRNIRATLLATFNAFMVVVASFLFFYFALTFARPNDTIANRVLFSFSATMVVAIAEVYFLIRII